MITSTLIEAARTLQAQFGPRFEASREGGRQRLAAALCRQSAIEASDAERIIATLERWRVIVWEPQPGIARPCPGVLELFGDWVIRPEHLQGAEAPPARGHAYAAV
jgi:hypothetical protein